MTNKVKKILESYGYTDICFNYKESNIYFFEGYTDALIEVRVEMNENEYEIYDRYPEEKHFSFFKKGSLS